MRALVGIHGGMLENLFWLAPHTTLLEVVPSGTPQWDPLFYYNSAVMELQYAAYPANSVEGESVNVRRACVLCGGVCAHARVQARCVDEARWRQRCVARELHPRIPLSPLRPQVDPAEVVKLLEQTLGVEPERPVLRHHYEWLEALAMAGRGVS